jgi:hypothetical protein
LTSIVVFFITKRFFFPTVGDYEKYNQIQFPTNVVMFNLKVVLFFAFLSWLLPCIIFLAITSFYFQGIEPDKSDITFVNWIKISNLKLILLFLASVIPYIAVGKGEGIILHSERYGLRHTIGFLIVIPLFFAVQHKFFSEKIKTRKSVSTLFLNVALSITILMYFGFSVNSILGSIEFQRYKSELINELRLQSDKIPEGRVLVILDKHPGEGFGLLDAQYVLFKATGNLKHWVNISDRDVPIEQWPLPRNDNRSDYSKYSLFEPYQGDCITKVMVESFDFTFSEPNSQLYKKVRLLFGWLIGRDSGIVAIKELKTSC